MPSFDSIEYVHQNGSKMASGLDDMIEQTVEENAFRNKNQNGKSAWFFPVSLAASCNLYIWGVGIFLSTNDVEVLYLHIQFDIGRLLALWPDGRILRLPCASD